MSDPKFHETTILKPDAHGRWPHGIRPTEDQRLSALEQRVAALETKDADFEPAYAEPPDDLDGGRMPPQPAWRPNKARKDDDEITRWAKALGNLPADIREGKNHDAGKALGTLAVSLLDQRDEIARLQNVIRTVVVNLERGGAEAAPAVAAWAKEQING